MKRMPIAVVGAGLIGRAHIDRRDRLKITCSGDRLDHVPAGDGDRAELRRFFPAVLPVIISGRRAADNEQEDED